MTVAFSILIPTISEVAATGEHNLNRGDAFASVTSGTVIAFVTLFRFVFNKYPIQALNDEIHSIAINIAAVKYKASVLPHAPRNDLLEISSGTGSDTAEKFLSVLAYNSRILATKIFSRAGIFLFIGLSIALSGLAFFYWNTPEFDGNQKETVMAIILAKNVGILIFIEFIAFFFLRLYRSAMDEFRHYESLQRSREETLAIVRLIKAKGDAVDVYQLIEKCGFRSNIDKLDNGQTTDLLESKKLNKDEAEIFNKILDILGKK